MPFYGTLASYFSIFFVLMLSSRGVARIVHSFSLLLLYYTLQVTRLLPYLLYLTTRWKDFSLLLFYSTLLILYSYFTLLYSNFTTGWKDSSLTPTLLYFTPTLLLPYCRRGGPHILLLLYCTLLLLYSYFTAGGEGRSGKRHLERRGCKR